jgi:hypothetical protein
MPNRFTDLAAKGGGTEYVSIAASAALTNSTTETTLDTRTIAANFLKAGDVVEIIGQGIATATNANDTLTIKIKLGGTVVCATAAVDVADNDVWFLHTFVTIRTDGASGTMVASGIQQVGVEGTATMRMDIVASSAVDTTGTLAAILTATWSAASAGNSCRNDAFIVKIHRPGAFD